jgi:hypothetical protein
MSLFSPQKIASSLPSGSQQHASHKLFGHWLVDATSAAWITLSIGNMPENMCQNLGGEYGRIKKYQESNDTSAGFNLYYFTKKNRSILLLSA